MRQSPPTHSVTQCSFPFSEAEGGAPFQQGYPPVRKKETFPRSWDKDVARFFASLKKLDSYLASEAPLGYPAEEIFQGPIADALTHVGQIAMLRRMASAPIRGENYFKAEIVAGRVGKKQSAKRIEFD